MAPRSFGYRMTKWMAGEPLLETSAHYPARTAMEMLRKAASQGRME